jgi:hypothetical protein
MPPAKDRRILEGVMDGENKIEAFLTHLAVNKNVAPSTRNQAMNALVFLYRKVLEIRSVAGFGERVVVSGSRAGRGTRLDVGLRLFPETVQRGAQTRGPWRG